VGDLDKRAKTLTPAPTEPLSCGCRVDADADADGDGEADLLLLRLTIAGVAEGERRTVGVIRGLQLLEALLVALPDLADAFDPDPAILARVVDTLDLTSL